VGLRLHPVEQPVAAAINSPAFVPRQSALTRFLAKLLDDAVKIPGTNIGVGLDSVIGLMPGVGDVVGSSLSTVILLDAVRMRLPLPVIAQMAWNLLLDAALGLLPFVGDLADVAHRANRKNLRLMQASIEAGVPEASGWGYVGAASLLVFGALGAVISSAVFAIWVLTKLLGA
jgi:Domain of unknown function (DUF4112)